MECTPSVVCSRHVSLAQNGGVVSASGQWEEGRRTCDFGRQSALGNADLKLKPNLKSFGVSDLFLRLNEEF